MSETMFQSQHGEDRWITEHLELPQHGTFCEVGAYDGIKSSNTYYFEKALNWNGILIEPDPETGSQCVRNRKGPVFVCACGMEIGDRPFYVNESDRGLSGLERTGTKTITWVVRLHYLLQLVGLNELTLLSIDTEGTELDVWDSIGFIRPKIVIVEYLTLGMEPKDEQITKRFKKDGYTEVHRTPCNLIFTR